MNIRPDGQEIIWQPSLLSQLPHWQKTVKGAPKWSCAELHDTDSDLPSALSYFSRPIADKLQCRLNRQSLPVWVKNGQSKIPAFDDYYLTLQQIAGVFDKFVDIVQFFQIELDCCMGIPWCATPNPQIRA